MNPEHLVQFCIDFDLGNPVSIEENHEGVLNRNYVLKTDKDSFFIKSVREKKKNGIPYIAAVEEFMASKGIPAICMLKSKDGSVYAEYDTDVYSGYPFIVSNRDHRYSRADFYSMGVMLGKIHYAGSKDIPETLRAREFNRNEDTLIATLKKYRKEISEKNELDDTDQLFLQYIDTKLTVIPSLLSITCKNDTLVHGDYHAKNLLVNDSREIIGVCDWEKAEVAPRAYEIARSIQYICFEHSEGPGKYDENEAVENSRAFLEGYISLYPISKEELIDGFHMRERKLAHSAWREDHYYVRNDNRSNPMIPHEIRLIKDFADDRLVNRILA